MIGMTTLAFLIGSAVISGGFVVLGIIESVLRRRGLL